MSKVRRQKGGGERLSALWGRSHYVTDTAIGILAVVFVILAVPRLMKRGNAAAAERWKKRKS